MTEIGLSEDQILDNPAWSALTGPQSSVAERIGRAARFHPELAPFAALDHDPDAAAWADAARLAAPDGLMLVAPQVPPPNGWAVTFSVAAVQMVAPELEGEPDPETVPLGGSDVNEMLELVRRTRPGPFMARTVEFGGYLGIRRGGALVAMAGERMRLPGWTEVSAVCTDEAFRGHGVATRLVKAVVAGIRARGDRALLHVAATNTGAIRLYRTLGFVERRGIEFVGATGPPVDM